MLDALKTLFENADSPHVKALSSFIKTSKRGIPFTRKQTIDS